MGFAGLGASSIGGIGSTSDGRGFEAEDVRSGGRGESRMPV